MITAGRLPQWSLLRIGTPPLSHFVGKYRNTKEQQRILKQQRVPQNRHTAAVTLRGELQKENSRKTQKGFRHTTVLCTWYVGSCCKQQIWSKFCKWTKIYTIFSTAGALVVIVTFPKVGKVFLSTHKLLVTKLYSARGFWFRVFISFKIQ